MQHRMIKYKLPRNDWNLVLNCSSRIVVTDKVQIKNHRSFPDVFFKQETKCLLGILQLLLEPIAAVCDGHSVVSLFHGRSTING